MPFFSDTEMLGVLLYNSEEAFLLTDANLIIKVFNKKATELLLLYTDKVPVVGDSILNFVRPGRIEAAGELYKRVLKGEEIYDESVFFIGDKEVVLKNNYKPLKDAEGGITGIIVLMSDITEALQARKVLQNTERRQKALAREGSEMTGIVDVEGFYSYVNPGCENVLGYMPGEFIGKNAFEFIHQEDEAAFNHSFSKLHNSNQVTIPPFRFRHKDGTFRWIETVATKMTDEPAVQGIVINSRDITERKKMQDQLMTSEGQLSLIYNTVSDIIFMLDVEDNEQYKLISVNHTLATATGIKEDEILNKYLQNFIPPANLASVLSKCRETIEQLSATAWEETMSFPAGTKTCIVTLTPVSDANGRCIKLIGSLHDVTTQKSEQQQLKLLESVVMNTNDVIMITSDGPLEEPGPHIIYVNEAFIKLTGYTPKEVVGKNPRFLQGKKTDKDELKRLSAILHKYESCKTELINYRKNGEEYWVDLYIFPLKDERGICTHWIAFERDITERKKQEIEREQLLHELTRSNKELKQFSYITSHNLRGPLTNLVAIADFIDTRHINDPATISLIEGFKVSTNQLNQTLNDLVKILIIKEAGTQEVESLSFENFYQLSLASLSFLIEDSGIQINRDFKQAEEVPFNNVYMESIFLNLITNAIKYRHTDRPAQLNICSKINNGKIQLVFEDNGIGMDLEKIKDRVFGLYQRFHLHKEGRGLGLYLIHSQVTAAGGSVAVESIVDTGTKFIITFK